MILLYGINEYSIAYFEENESCDSAKFVTTQSEERFGVSSLSFDDAIAQFPDSEIIIFSTFSKEIISSLIHKNYPLKKVSVYNRFLKRRVETEGLIHRYQYTNDEVLHCVYDLNNCLVTFDFFLYLVNAEIERIKRGLQFIKVHIVLPLDGTEGSTNLEDSTFRNGEHADIDYILGRVSGIIEPLCQCHKKVLSVSRHTRDDFAAYCTALGEFEAFPVDFSNSRLLRQYYYSNIESDLRHYAHELEGFVSAPKSTIELVDRFLSEFGEGRKPIVITLREYDFQHHRNSKHDDWVRFIENLDHQEYFPIIVRDTYKVYAPFPETKAYIFNEASIDLKVRMALYQRAYLNLSVNCGPSSLFYFLDNCHSIEFRDVNPESISTTSEQMYKASLMVEGEQPFYAKKNRNLVHWADDTFDNINQAFNQFVSEETKRNTE
ncbi:hypothetical protein EYS14_08055 [Alteromonadaceae bacterium M269]|nr:hypothetical protein EYS14_08055 [Alteromonadaceae bacterium M269]